MKKIIAFLLTLIFLVPMIPAKAETVAAKPYYGIGSSDFSNARFPNLEGRHTVSVNVKDGEVYLSTDGASRDIDAVAAAVKSALDNYPEGMRTFVLHKSSGVFQLQKDTIYFEEGAEKLKTEFSAFIKTYAEIGGKLDGVVLDVEYVDTHNWYLYSRQYTKGNPDVYKNIVENPRYKTDIRPMLVERGFKFYEDTSKPEIWSIFPKLKGAEAEEYAISQTIWNTVMRIRLNNYMTEAVYEPLAQYMPGVPLYDYQSRATNAWLKDLTDKGEHNYVAGNSVPVGAISHHNTYGSRLSNDFFAVDGQPVYNNPVAYNGAEFAATPFNYILWDVNLMKNMYEASGGNIAVTVAEYDYSPNKVGTPSNTPYYTEAVFHIGLLDPKMFSIYMYKNEFTAQEYNKRAKVLQQIMAELTRVAGYADRKPIAVPVTWNSSFILSGIYANGRNLWRLTPDSSKFDPQKSAIGGENPTFVINGQTIIFPQGKFIDTGSISVVGSYGYWIETPKNVTPIITNDPDRYSKNPSFAEDFESYSAGTAFNTANALPATCWRVSGTAPVVRIVDSNKVLALTDTVTVSNEKLPQNITAGDSYAKQQAWEVSVTLPENFSGELKLLTCGDGGIKIADGKVYYDAGGNYEELTGVKLSAEQKYTLKREMDFRNTYVCNYTILDAAGKVIGQVIAVPIVKISLPVTKIAISCTDVTGNVLVDDYKLYPTGITTDFEVYNAKTGIRQKDITQKSGTDVAYRLSWLNGSNTVEQGEVVATFYNAAGTKVSQRIVETVQMKPGCDGIETGTVQVPQGQSVALQIMRVVGTPKATTPTENTESSAVKTTVEQTTKVTGQQSTKATAPKVTKPTRATKATAQKVTKATEQKVTNPAEENVTNATAQKATKPTATKPIAEKVTSPAGQDATKPVSGEMMENASATKATQMLAGEPTQVTEEGNQNLTETQASDELQETTQTPSVENTVLGTDETEASVAPKDNNTVMGTVLWIVIPVVVLGSAGAVAWVLYPKKKKAD